MRDVVWKRQTKTYSDDGSSGKRAVREIHEEIGLYPSAQRKRAGGWWKPDEAEVCEDHFRAALQNLFVRESTRNHL